MSRASWVQKEERNKRKAKKKTKTQVLSSEGWGRDRLAPKGNWRLSPQQTGTCFMDS